MIERRIQLKVPNQRNRPLDPVTAIAIVWSSIFMGGTVHGFNGGTYEDQIKILMNNQYEFNGKIDFTIEEILDLWNNNKHGKPHTRQQATNAIQALKAKGKVTSTESGHNPKGRSYAKYSLVSVLEKATAPPVEEAEIKRPNEIPGTDDFPGTVVRTTPDEFTKGIGPIMGKLKDLSNTVAENQEVVVGSLSGFSELTVQQRETYNKLVSVIQGLINSNAEITNNNNAALQKFVTQTNSNFKELEEHYDLLRELFSSKFETHAVESKAIMDAYKSGFKEGFKEGRADYRDDLLSNSKAIEDRG